MKNLILLKKKYGITDADLKNEYSDRYSSEYLKECTEEKLIELIINEQVFKVVSK